MFGLSARPPPDRFLVGLATLTLIAEVAEEKPLVCIVDDAQWLDDTSAQVLAFVARRIHAERIAIVCAARTGPGEGVLAGLPQLAIAGLGERDARVLLLDNVLGPLDDAVCDRIVSESQGNPLALLELPRTWTSPADFAGGFGFPSNQPVAGRIEQSYVQRLLDLPDDTRLLAVAAAAEPLGDPVLLHRVAEILGLDMVAVDPAAEAGLLKVGTRSSSHTRSFAPPPTDRRRMTSASVCIAPSLTPPTPTPIPTGVHGIAPAPPLGRANGWPRSWSVQREERRHAEDLPPLQPSSSVRSR